MVPGPSVPSDAAVAYVKHVVVADPDPLTRRMAFNSLVTPQCCLSDAATADDLQRVMDEVHPDLVLLDSIILKARPDLLEHLRETHPMTQVVLLNNPDETASDASIELTDACVDKPFSPTYLLKVVQSLLGERVEDSIETPRPMHDLERQQLLLYARDLSRLRREDEIKSQQLRAANARLHEFEKMKDMFLALVSHELRTPLTIIKGNTHLLRRLLKGAEAGSREDKLLGLVQSVGTASARLENLTFELMNYSSVRSGVAPFELRSVDLRLVLGSVIKELEPLAQSKSVHFHFDREGPKVIAQADATRMREAFIHIVKNAILYNVAQGTVVVVCQSYADRVEVRITDTGPGVAPEQSEKVFSPFYQGQDVLTRRVEGIGLGLAITRHIVESHGGRIRLLGELGHGTEARISLPFKSAGRPVVEFAPKPVDELLAGDPATDLTEYARELYGAYEGERVRRRQGEEQNRQMERTFLETLAALMRQIDIRGVHHGSHVDRVVYFANEIGRVLDPTLPDNRDFYLSLLLHDIGKIGVAENLLQKVGKLTDDEQRQLQAHASIGAHLLDSVEFLRPALNGVRHHHERWDGKGYPDGLAGSQIPLWARIISVADSFDAMIHDRPYRKALTLEDARLEIVRNSGTQYDPEVVEAFLSCWHEFETLVRESNQVQGEG
jgi:response regulator RpfG family c-di-GMP phosphodiesterase